MFSGIDAGGEKHPKLATMLFIAHSGATAINAGKVYFTKNPMAINYPQWIAFVKYSYKQIKWVLLEKSEARDAYVSGKLYDDLKGTCFMVDKCFEKFSSGYIVVFDSP
ncbi:hypothetical protein [Lacrimispora aerotolerans]|uniref:hypothetical protein n=1 Tax=Lacrimispora aerotolerans TaxID=36832 RepID=UPI00047C73C2|nr:hypothetical protein [Lacrimispora aerotolerans]